MTEKLINITKEDWRKLGFYYERDDVNKKWILIGSKNGLENFCIILDRYVENRRNMRIGEHEHIGPYSYLIIMTSKVFNVTSDHICGSLEDLKKLNIILKTEIRNILDQELPTNKLIEDNFVNGNNYMIELRLMEYGYDPATADTQLWGNAEVTDTKSEEKR
jgi:hypothetical protein